MRIFKPTPSEIIKEEIGKYLEKGLSMNKTIKVIDLLNKIVNDEEVPKKIHYLMYDYKYDDEWRFYYRKNYDNVFYSLFDDYNVINSLNDEVEIIEEPQEHKIPEKFEVHSWGDKDKYGSYVDSPFPTEEEFMNKINEILDYLKETK